MVSELAGDGRDGLEASSGRRDSEDLVQSERTVMPTTSRIERIRDVAAARQGGLTLVLEDVHDPHNAEAVFRSCDAFGVQDVHLIFDNEAPFDPRRVGKVTSASANKWLTFSSHGSIADCIKSLRAARYRLVAAVPSPQGEDLVEADLTAPRLALLFGNEHRGLSDTALEAADMVLSIATVGMVRSLNLSVAAAVCLYEVTRQRNASGCNIGLSAAALSALTGDWLDRA